MIKVESGVFGILQNNCYLLTEEESGESALVDCAVYDERMQAFVRGRNLKYLLLTHGHFDHIGGAAALRAATGAKVVVHKADAPMLASGTKNLGEYFRIPCDAVPCDGTVHGGDILRLGKTPITVIETPGMDFLRRESLRPLYDFAAQQRLTPEGTVCGRDIVNAASDGAMLRYYEAWLPVGESEG